MPIDIEIDHIDCGVRLGQLKIARHDFDTPFHGINHNERRYLNEGKRIIKTSLPDIRFMEVVTDLSIKPGDNIDIGKMSQSILRKSNRSMSVLSHFRFSNDITKDQLLDIVTSQIDSEASEVITIPDPTLRKFDYNWKNSY